MSEREKNVDQQREWLAERFETERPHLRAVAYRMLGRLEEADDAVQECWLRLSRSDTSEIENLGGWLTTVVARVCLDMLRSRQSRREEPLVMHVPDPIVSSFGEIDPEQEALLADSVGLALLVVLETLRPAERIAFVLHDVFAVPFEEIAGVVGRTPTAARQLASRARRRVQGVGAAPDTDRTLQREVIEAFLAAARSGDFDALLTVLDPNVMVRGDDGTVSEAHGAPAVARQFLGRARGVQPALVNGTAGAIAIVGGQLFVVMSFTIRGGKIVEIDVLANRERLSKLRFSIQGN